MAAAGVSEVRRRYLVKGQRARCLQGQAAVSDNWVMHYAFAALKARLYSFNF